MLELEVDPDTDLLTVDNTYLKSFDNNVNAMISEATTNQA